MRGLAEAGGSADTPGGPGGSFSRTGWTEQERYNQEWTDLRAEEMEEWSPQEIISWAVDQFGDKLGLATSFQAESSVLVHLFAGATQQARTFYLDTEALFAQTYMVRDRLIERYDIKPVRFRPALSFEDQATVYGDRLWETNPDLCCEIRKVQPLKLALSGLDAWMTGIRRDQAATRAHARVVEWDKRGLVKINPLVRLTSADVWNYIAENNIPYNELHDQGYPSIGCTHCTRAVAPGEDPRSGRWSGTGKIECGLHEPEPAEATFSI
ncbi:MAG: phosphoadenylyl-sulfate reductase [Dehalococcoidia bacterium]|nr:phosphoadenylyl-sulfate reductase [Dehalococcoidia bacterium]